LIQWRIVENLVESSDVCSVQPPTIKEGGIKENRREEAVMSIWSEGLRRGEDSFWCSVICGESISRPCGISRETNLKSWSYESVGSNEEIQTLSTLIAG